MIEVIRETDGFLALRKGGKHVFVLRLSNGRVTPGAEMIVKSIEEGHALSTAGLPREIFTWITGHETAKATESVDLSADIIRDGNGRAAQGTS